MEITDEFIRSRTGPYLPDYAPTGETSVSGFEILGQLGRGGMGVVYHAREVALNRPVALKLVLGADRADRKALIRFLAEAEAAAAIDHPHVVRVYRYGEADGQPYMALEYLPGGSLAGKTGERWPIRAAAELVRKVARGVEAAHALGIVHRDLKPANILLDAAGEPKVADFGLARRGPSDLTQTGTVMGTPAYMAPEQAKGESKFVGPGADVWALGIILYECLTGQRPFGGDDTWVVLQQVIAEEPVRPRTLEPQIPRDLELICLKCLSKAPYERYAAAGELADDLERFASGQAVSVRAAGPAERIVKWARRKPTLAGLYTAAAVAMLLLAFGGVVAGLWRSEANARAEAVIEQGKAEAARGVAVVEQGKAEAARGEAERAKGGEAKAREQVEAAFQREGFAHADTRKAREALADQDALRKVDLAHRSVAADNALRGLRLLNTVDPDRRSWEWRYVARLAQPEVRRFSSNGGTMCNAAVSADAQRVYASCSEGVRSWDLASSRELTGYRGHAEAVRHVVLHPDGLRAVSAAADGSVHVWDTATGKLLKAFQIERVGEIVRLAISPDGKTLAVGRPSGIISLWNLDTFESAGDLKGHNFIVSALRFRPKRELFSGGFDGTLRHWNLKTIAEASPPQRHPGIVWAIGITRDGNRMCLGTENGTLWRYKFEDDGLGKPVRLQY